MKITVDSNKMSFSIEKDPITITPPPEKSSIQKLKDNRKKLVDQIAAIDNLIISAKNAGALE